MSDYGPPAPPPSTASASAPVETDGKADPGSTGGTAHFVQLTNYAAAGLGVLAFIWGFLDWYSYGSGSNSGQSGFATVGGAGIGLALVAGLLALATLFDKTDTTLMPSAFAAAGLLVIFGNLVATPDGVSTDLGLILALITALLQVAVLAYGWLLSSGRMAAPAPKPPKPQGPPPGYGSPQGYQQGPPPGYGSPQGPPPGYRQGPPPGYGAPQGPPPGYQQGPPPGYGAPQGPPPGYQQGPPPGYGAPSGYGSPQSPPPSQSPPPPASDATQVFSRPTFAPNPGEQSAAEQPTPDQSAPEQPAPEQPTPDQAAPEHPGSAPNDSPSGPSAEAPRDWSRPSDGYGQ